MNEPRAEYGRRLKAWRERLADFERRHLILSNCRLAVAAAIAVAVWFAFVRFTLSAWWVVLAAIGFAALAVVHARLLQRLERGRRASALYERALDRLEGRWHGQGRDGAAFLDDHPYARDLDLFGHASLFELLNTARTEAGEATLARWLGAGAAIDEVQARQAAVDELRPKLDFREDLAVLAAEGEVSRTGSLGTWAVSAPVRFAAAVPLMLGACAALMVVFAILAWFDVVPWSIPAGWGFVEYGIARIWRRSLDDVVHRVGKPADDLALLAELVACIEREPALAPKLAALRGAFTSHGVIASRAIARLTQFVSLRESSVHNLLFAPFTAALLVPDQLTIAIDRWHATHGHAVDAWLAAVGELEALSAISTFAYEHPADPFPTVVTDGPMFEAEALTHPLIREDMAVRNDVRLGGTNPRLVVLSGSNMSGKSTLLRAVGVNVVLALAGAPVRASRLRVSPLALGATLRVTDSLEAGRSRFYAEILRIRSIVETARGPVPLLFLLDEILHGTNSYDRRIGAEAIVRALVGAGAIGFITTHDLALAELPSRLGGVAANMHFQDRIDDGKMLFDYRLRPGVVEHSNALALMRAVGLEV